MVNYLLFLVASFLLKIKFLWTLRTMDKTAQTRYKKKQKLTNENKAKKCDSQDNLYQKFTTSNHVSAPEVRITHFYT